MPRKGAHAQPGISEQLLKLNSSHCRLLVRHIIKFTAPSPFLETSRDVGFGSFSERHSERHSGNTLSFPATDKDGRILL